MKKGRTLPGPYPDMKVIFQSWKSLADMQVFYVMGMVNHGASPDKNGILSVGKWTFLFIILQQESISSFWFIGVHVCATPGGTAVGLKPTVAACSSAPRSSILFTLPCSGRAVFLLDSRPWIRSYGRCPPFRSLRNALAMSGLMSTTARRMWWLRRGEGWWVPAHSMVFFGVSRWTNGPSRLDNLVWLKKQCDQWIFDLSFQNILGMKKQQMS